MSSGQVLGYVITTVTGAPASTLLTSLNAVHVELSIASGTTGDDPWFVKSLSRVSAEIAKHCNQVFAPASYQDVIRPNNGIYASGVRPESDPILTRRWPLIQVSSVIETRATYETTLTLGTDYEVKPEAGELYRLDIYGNPRIWRADAITIAYTAGYMVTGEAATVPATAPYTVTAAEAMGAWQADGGITYANGMALARVTGVPSAGQYALVTPTNAVAPGSYQLSAADANASLLLSYAYTPFDLEQAALSLIKLRYFTRSRDPTVTQEAVVGVSSAHYEIPSLGAAGFPTDIEAMLARYRVPALG